MIRTSIGIILELKEGEGLAPVPGQDPNKVALISGALKALNEGRVKPYVDVFGLSIEEIIELLNNSPNLKEAIFEKLNSSQIEKIMQTWPN